LQRQALLTKGEKVREVRDTIQKYQVIGIASLQKVRASQLQELRRRLKHTAHIRVIKNTLVEQAIHQSQERPNVEKLNEYLKGSNLFLFTNLNPFRLALLLEKSKVKDIAKAGDIVTEDVVVPAGNTGIPPGPIISQLGSVGIPTRIESGSVWVNRDTVVARRGEVISETLAPVLSKLGIKAIEMGLSLKVVYDDGTIVPEEDLKLDLEEHRKSIGEAYIQGLTLSLNATYPTAENIAMLVLMASTEAFNLAFNASFLTRDTIADLIRKAYFQALALVAKIPADITEIAK